MAPKDDTASHSTGRGGAGNIGKQDNATSTYTDGSIYREGEIGKSADGAEYSTGRGGTGNIAYDPHGKGQPGPRTDTDFVPETAARAAQDKFHTGRGGEGNRYKEKYGGHSSAEEQRAAELRAAQQQQQPPPPQRSGSGFGESVKHMVGMGKGEEKRSGR